MDPETVELIHKLRLAGFSDDQIKEYVAKKNATPIGAEIEGGAAKFLQGASLGLAGHIDPELKYASDEFSKRHKILGPLTNIAGNVVSALATPASWGAKVAGRALLGGGTAAIAAGAEGEGSTEDRLKRAAIAAPVGAAAGVAIPFAAGTAGKMLKRIVQPLRNPANIVAEATGPLLPENAAAMMQRQEMLAPGTAIPAGMSPELPSAARVIGANPKVAFEAEAASAGRAAKLQAAKDELSVQYKQVLSPNGKPLRAPLDMGGNANIRKVIIQHGLWPGDETIEAEAVQGLRNNIQSKMKALRLSVRRTGKGGPELHRLGQQNKALTAWLEEVAPGIRPLDKDFRILSDAQRTEDVVVKNIKKSRQAYGTSRAAGIEPGSPGATLPSRGGFFHTLMHPDRAKLAEATNNLLLQPGSIPDALLKARARSLKPPVSLDGLLPFLSGSTVGRGAGLLFDE